MKTELAGISQKLQQLLDKRKEEFLCRSLQVNDGLIDFCSNDYLSFARSQQIKLQVEKQLAGSAYLSGSTGSRSISGNTKFVEELEQNIADFHNAEAGLIFNSGYDANIGLFSSIAQKGDTIICDELIHASIIDGCRLSHATRFRFAHNDVTDLERKLQHATGNLPSLQSGVFVAVESVYSMDGDASPLNEIAELCEKFGAALIVDEAHATGVFGYRGKGLVNHLNLEKKVFARIHTFGKSLGGHGAIILGDETLRNYLINFARSFIFTTALPVQSLVHVECAYRYLGSSGFDNSYLHKLIQHFKINCKLTENGVYLLESFSPVQSVVIPGNERVRAVSKFLQDRGFDVRAILSPSVPKGKERLRISLHAHNTFEQADKLLKTLNETLV